MVGSPRPVALLNKLRVVAGRSIDFDITLDLHTKLSHVGLCGLTGLVATSQRYSFTFFTRASRCFTFTRITLPKLDAWTPVVIEVFERVCDVLPRLAPPPVSW